MGGPRSQLVTESVRLDAEYRRCMQAIKDGRITDVGYVASLARGWTRQWRELGVLERAQRFGIAAQMLEALHQSATKPPGS